VRIVTLGRFEVSVGGQPRIEPKMPRQSQMLLKTLIALGGADIPEHAVADELWPNSEGDAARRALTTALHRLRKLLGGTSALEVRAGRISINRNRVSIDSWEFEALSERLDKQSLPGLAELAARAVNLYRGPFLSGDMDILGGLSKRETLRRKFVRLVTREARRLEELHAYESATSLYSHALSAESANECFQRGLERCQAAEYSRHAPHRADDGLGQS
jgi:two-component SAPR family response regulator